MQEKISTKDLSISPASTDVSSEYSDTPTFQQEAKTKNAIRRRDRIVFTLNLLNLIISAALVTRDAKYYAYWSVLLTAVTLSHRTYEFYLKGMHFYMMDFCYLVNWIVVGHIVLFPKSEIWFYAGFALSLGPIIYAIPYFRCTLALHSTEKATSFLVHSYPPVSMFLIHWHDKSKLFISSNNGIQEFGLEMLMKWYGSIILLYGVWVVVYYAVQFKILRRHIVKNKYQTLYDYSMADPRTSKRLRSRGDSWSQFMFIFIHFRYVLIFTTMALAFYYSYWIGLLWIVYNHLTGIYNGATFYINLHSERYEKNILLSAFKNH